MMMACCAINVTHGIKGLASRLVKQNTRNLAKVMMNIIAKQAELKKWNDVYTQVEDLGQYRISTQWRNIACLYPPTVIPLGYCFLSLVLIL